MSLILFHIAIKNMDIIIARVGRATKPTAPNIKISVEKNIVLNDSKKQLIMNNSSNILLYPMSELTI